MPVWVSELHRHGSRPAGTPWPTVFLNQGGATVLPTHVGRVRLGKTHVGNLSNKSHNQYDGPVVARASIPRSLTVWPAAYRSTRATATRISQYTQVYGTVYSIHTPDGPTQTNCLPVMIDYHILPGSPIITDGPKSYIKGHPPPPTTFISALKQP